MNFELQDDRPSQQKAVNGSFATISSLINGMIGGCILLLPILFSNSGLLLGLLLLALVGMVQYILSDITYRVLNDDEIDQDFAIKRILGQKHWIIFQVSYLFTGLFACVFYYTLIVDQLYSMLMLMFELPPKESYDLSQFSFQYLNVLVALLVSVLISINDINLVFKISELGVITVYIYVAFVVYHFIQGQGYYQPSLFGHSYMSLILSANFGFNLQGYFVTVLRINRRKQDNLLLLKFVYFLTFVIYATIGVFGMFVIQVKDGPAKPQTFMDYFTQDKNSAALLELGYSIHIITALPANLKVCRLRFSGWKDIGRNLFNSTFVLLCLTLVGLKKFIPLQLILDLNGSLFAYMISFFYPVYTFYVLKEQKAELRLWQKLGLLILAVGGLAVCGYGLYVSIVQGLK